MRASWLPVVVLCLAAAGIAAAVAGVPADRSLTVSGTVSRVQSAERSFTVTLSDGSEARFVWSSDTRFSGVLTPGARVTIRYDVSADGRNVAQQISAALSIAQGDPPGPVHLDLPEDVSLAAAADSLAAFASPHPSPLPEGEGAQTPRPGLMA